MRRIKWFVPARDDDSYNPFGLVDVRAATLYSSQDGCTTAGPAEASPDERAQRNRAFWEATEPSVAQPETRGLLDKLLRRREAHR